MNYQNDPLKSIKHKNVANFLFAVAWLLTVGFAIRLFFDYKYFYPWYSAPFYLYVIERFVEFIFPAAALFIIGVIIKKRGNKER